MVLDMKSKGTNPFPHKFDVTISNVKFIEKYHHITKRGEFMEDTPVSVAGRVYSIRAAGQGLIFYEIISDNSKLQVYCNAKYIILFI